MPWKPPAAAPKCPVCGKSVYAAEQALGPGGVAYHKQGCFRCTAPGCGRGLDSTTACDHDGKLLCKTCYGKSHGPKGFGFAGGAATVLRAEDPPSSSAAAVTADAAAADTAEGSAPATQAPRAAPAKAGGASKPTFGGAPKCPKCVKSVYAAEQVLAAGSAYHKACLRCGDCGKGLDSSTLNDRDGDVFCSACYRKEFGPKGTRAAMGMHTT